VPSADTLRPCAGGSFLLQNTAPDDIFTFEDLTEEHLAIARTAEQFWQNEVLPRIDDIQHQKPGVALNILRKSAELGLTAITIPEEFGGMELDLTSSLVADEYLSRDASYAAWHGAHTGIGTLPLLYFGTEAQKRKYLPKLANMQMLAAYALTEPHAGSDALAARTRADLSPDGKYYLLNGQKMWITNGGSADLFTVFAKAGGEKFTAFLVERAFGGLTSGAEEKKMGIKGSSTTAVYFENVPVPVENVLGEVGRGHIIAFNILNIGRLKLGALSVGGAKDVLATSLQYAKQRKAFGSAIAAFGAIQYKLAEMAIRIYAAESVSWRVAGLIENQLSEFSWTLSDAPSRVLKAVEEFALECSIVKVYGSEALDYVVDEGVQIHGGYGFHQDYSVERSYRDSRINRIFEGTNEINRLLIVGMLLKRAARGQLALQPAVQNLVGEITSGQVSLNGLDEEPRLVQNAKRIALLAIGMSHQKLGAELESHQQVCMKLADILIEAFAMESAWLRNEKLAAKGKLSLASDMCAVFLREAMARVELAARDIIGALAGTGVRANMQILRRLAVYDPIDTEQARHSIATRLLERERYAL
jgi:butyryl-CoA dehydrogenase